ncbi:hypothetical protein ERM42_01245 [Clostridioides difficile]|nr:hypothetical protein [Clostridioides difficile]ELX4523372.1 hypothetical protein [Clostridioides difficile]MCO8785283.1 hypothetical protein [Clostridioides difficile]MCO8824434.1 hypothetical protein [Clostridioides difficile]MCW0845073.1 hypothetical protein [Clostridioides difficile]
MTFKELVNKVRNLVLEAEKVTIEDTENNFTSDNVEGALKEVFQSGVNAKNNVVTALNSKGAEVTTSDTWEEIKNKIDKKEGRLDLKESIIASSYTPCLVTNGTIKYIEKYTGGLTALEYETPYFYAVKGTHLIKINANDESVVFDTTLVNANFSCICITQDYLFISDNTKLYKINKITGIEVQSIANTYYKLCAYGDYVYGIYGSATSSTIHKIRVSDMYIMLTKNLSSDGIYGFNRGRFVCNKNGIYATTEHSTNPSSYTDCYLSKINFDFTVVKSFGIGGYLYNKTIKFMNDFVFVSDTNGKIETGDNGKTSGLVKYDVNLNQIAYANILSCVNFEVYNGYVYILFSSATHSDPFQKLDSNTFKTIQYFNTFYTSKQVVDMIITNNIIFFINSIGIYRNVVSRKVYSQEKGEIL